MLSAAQYNGVGYSSVKSIYKMAGMNTQIQTTYYRNEAKCEKKIVQCDKNSALKAQDNFSAFKKK